MGGGSFDSKRYYDDTTTRATRGIDDFSYTKTATAIHPSLDPTRINTKPGKKLESRDSAEHPESNAVLLCFDVTGSNYTRAVQAQKALPSMMALLPKYLPDAQVAVAANDDFFVAPTMALQISEFESDNRVDEHIRNIILVRNGGGNDGESYDLALYAAARKTSIDCFDKRGRKGYFFIYADEPFFEQVSARQVQDVFGDSIQRDIPIAEIIAEARKQYEVFVLWPVGGYAHAHDQYIRLFGEEYVIVLQHPERICEVVAATIGINEEKVDAATAIADLVSVGQDATTAKSLVNSLVALSRSKAVGTVSHGSLAATGSKASRL
jgi:hypothetical protein